MSEQDNEEKLNNLCEQFLKEVSSLQSQIKCHIDDAYYSLNKAIKLSEELGLPFYSSISPLGQTYSPASY